MDAKGLRSNIWQVLQVAFRVDKLSPNEQGLREYRSVPKKEWSKKWETQDFIEKIDIVMHEGRAYHYFHEGHQ